MFSKSLGFFALPKECHDVLIQILVFQTRTFPPPFSVNYLLDYFFENFALHVASHVMENKGL